MEGWKYWEGKKVFVTLKNKRQYQGKVILVNVDKNEVIEKVRPLNSIKRVIEYHPNSN